MAENVSWDDIIKLILTLPSGVNVLVPKKIGLPPNAKRTIGEASILKFGKDYEITLPDGRRIHIVELKDCYKVHWDRYSPLVDPIKHLKVDSPQWYSVIESLFRFIRSKF